MIITFLPCLISVCGVFVASPPHHDHDTSPPGPSAPPSASGHLRTPPPFASANFTPRVGPIFPTSSPNPPPTRPRAHGVGHMVAMTHASLYYDEWSDFMRKAKETTLARLEQFPSITEGLVGLKEHEATSGLTIDAIREHDQDTYIHRV
jgi:hypothetical protein